MSRDFVKPIHPIVVHFPIALLVTSVVSDAAYFFSSLETLHHAGWWMIFAAAATGVATVAAGVFDMRRAALGDDVHEKVHRHMWVGVALLAVVCALALWRWTFFAKPAEPLSALYLDFGLLAVALAAFQGWLGGELVYTHGVSVQRDRHTSPPSGKKPHASAPHSH